MNPTYRNGGQRYWTEEVDRNGALGHLPYMVDLPGVLFPKGVLHM